MARLRLHLDADASSRAVYHALLDRGHDITRTPNEWMPDDAPDMAQLLGATDQGRCLFTFNVADFPLLAERHPDHAGLILAAQSRWTVRELIEALNRVLSESDASQWVGCVRWLNTWRT